MPLNVAFDMVGDGTHVFPTPPIIKQILYEVSVLGPTVRAVGTVVPRRLYHTGYFYQVENGGVLDGSLNRVFNWYTAYWERGIHNTGDTNATQSIRWHVEPGTTIHIAIWT